MPVRPKHQKSCNWLFLGFAFLVVPAIAEETDKNGALFVTETDGEKQWQVYWANTNPKLPQTEMIIPPGEVFVLGDNRAASNDSRFFGTVHLQDVIGKARQVWLSVKGNEVKWERMGQVLK
ncbi:signal peptidase I [Thiothrix nivea]|nr:signal peptidase I [Thiothrix nivea]